MPGRRGGAMLWEEEDSSVRALLVVTLEVNLVVKLKVNLVKDLGGPRDGCWRSNALGGGGQ